MKNGDHDKCAAGQLIVQLGFMGLLTRSVE